MVGIKEIRIKAAVLDECLWFGQRTDRVFLYLTPKYSMPDEAQAIINADLVRRMEKARTTMGMLCDLFAEAAGTQIAGKRKYSPMNIKVISFKPDTVVIVPVELMRDVLKIRFDLRDAIMALNKIKADKIKTAAETMEAIKSGQRKLDELGSAETETKLRELTALQKELDHIKIVPSKTEEFTALAEGLNALRQEVAARYPGLGF